MLWLGFMFVISDGANIHDKAPIKERTQWKGCNIVSMGIITMIKNGMQGGVALDLERKK